MLDTDDIRDVLARCAAYDPSHFPKKSAAVADVWFEHCAQFRHLTRDDMRAAVREYYTQPDRRVPGPADITVIARKYSRERYERSALDSPERCALEDKCDGLAAPDDDDLLALESAEAADRRGEVEAYAATHGCTPGQAAARIVLRERSRRDTGSTDAYHRALAAQQRAAAPPVPLPPETAEQTATADVGAAK